jgi:flagellar biosynthesis protein FlhA
VLSIIGGTAIGTLLKGETINNAIMTYMPLSLCNGFLAVLFCFLESNIAGFVVTKAVLSDEQSKNHNSKSKDH